MIDLDALQAAAQAATPGPWEADCFEDWGTQPQSAVFAGELPLTSDNQTGHVFKQSDAEFIAAVNPAVVLELIARVRRSDRDLAACDAAFRGLKNSSANCDVERLSLRSERDAALARIARVEAAIVKGSLMDVTPTRMTPETAFESESWWQNWHRRADVNWRENLRAALSDDPVS